MKNKSLIYVFKVFLLAASYFAMGKFSQLLAIPPGFASPVWPAAGVALCIILLIGYRYLLGVLLGSFAVNLDISLASGSTIHDINTLLIAVVIAMGATLQTFVGVSMIKRVVIIPSPMEREFDLVMILLLGGPIACLVNALIGPTTLMFAGFIPNQETFLLNMFVWWAGDTIGVIAITPIFLLLAVTEKRVTTSRKLFVIVPSIIFWCVVIILFVIARKDSQETTKDEFTKLVMVEVNRVESNLLKIQNNLSSIKYLFATHNDISRDVFNTFSTNYIDKFGLRTIDWIPRVLANEKSKIEEKAHFEGFSEFRIRGTARQDTSLSKGITEYYPILYRVSSDNSYDVLGFDLASERDRMAELVNSRESGDQTASSTFIHFGERKMFIITPVFRVGAVVDTLMDRRTNIIGYVVGEIQIKELIQDALTDLSLDQFSMEVIDNKIEGHAELIYGSRIEKSDILNQQSISFSGRQWTLNFAPTKLFLEKQSGWQAWSVLIGGLFFATSIQVILLIITARTAVVDRLVKEKSKTLWETELKTRGIVDNIPDGILSFDESGIIDSINNAGENIFGYQKVELIGQSINLLISSSNNGYLKPYFEPEKKSVIGGRQELEGTHKNGSVFPIELSVNEIKFESFRMFSGIVRDITERKASELQQSMLIEELSHTCKELERFAYICSHDLQEPVRMVISFGQLLEKNMADQLDDKNKEYLAFMIEGATRARAMISDILTFCQLGQVTEEKTWVNITDICKSVENTLKLSLKQKNAVFRWDNDLPRVYAFNSKLFLLFMNLVNNGLKFNTSDSPEIYIDFKEDKEKYHIRVKDNGIGIDDKHYVKIFNLFHRLVSKSDFPGTGLGLAICKKIADEHSADLSIVSKVGHGSQFILSWEKKTD